MRRTWPFHPVLFGAYPVLSLYAANTSLFPATDLWVPLSVVVGGALLAMALLWALVRNVDRAAAGASVLAVGFFSFGPILDVIATDPSVRSTNARVVIYLWAPALVLLVVAACWKWRRIGAVTRFLNITSVALFLFPAFAIGSAWMKGAQIPVASVGKSAAYQGPRPDIFFILLDGYGRSDVLRREMGFDNTEFLKGLRDLGFYVADQSQSNYCQTELSLTSILNMDFLPKVVPSFDPNAQSRFMLDGLIDRNRVSVELRKLGYGYIGVTTGFPAVHPESADLVLQTQSGGTLFETALMQRTPLSENAGLVTSAYETRRQTLKTAIGTLGELGHPSVRPRFIFAHILAPHPPFVFGPNGEPVQPHRQFALVDGSHFMQNGGTREEYRAGYAGQAQTVSRMVLQSIRQLLKNESTPPIVIIQGDHGPKLNLDQELLEKTDVNEVFPILNTYYVPPKVREKLYPGITPVNSFRTIFREQFGYDLPNLPDRSFYSSWTWPFKFVDVTDRIGSGGENSNRS